MKFSDLKDGNLSICVFKEPIDAKYQTAKKLILKYDNAEITISPNSRIDICKDDDGRIYIENVNKGVGWKWYPTEEEFEKYIK